MNLDYWLQHTDSLFHQIFMIVMGSLMGLAHLFGTTYKVINIFVYFILVPSSWIYLVSRKTSVWLNLISLLLLLIFVLTPDLESSSGYLFQRSVDFLNWLAGLLDSNYIDMSVYICVLVIGIVYLILIPLTLPKKLTKFLFITLAIALIGYLFLVYPYFKKCLIWGIDKAGYSV